MSKVQFARVAKYSAFMRVVMQVLGFQFGVFHKQSTKTCSWDFKGEFFCFYSKNLIISKIKIRYKIEEAAKLRWHTLKRSTNSQSSGIRFSVWSFLETK